MEQGATRGGFTLLPLHLTSAAWFLILPLSNSELRSYNRLNYNHPRDVG